MVPLMDVVPEQPEFEPSFEELVEDEEENVMEGKKSDEVKITDEDADAEDRKESGGTLESKESARASSYGLDISAVKPVKDDTISCENPFSQSPADASGKAGIQSAEQAMSLEMKEAEVVSAFQVNSARQT